MHDALRGTPEAARIEWISRIESAAARSVGPPMRHVDDDAAGGFVLPGLRERQHVGALARRQAAAIAADEDLDGVLAFLQA